MAKQIQNDRFIVIFDILRQTFNIVGAITLSSILAASYCRVRSCLNIVIIIF